MKRGFTLIETVVTVGIVAAMAAVVIPQVARQFDTADPTRVQNDLKNIQTAMETYYVNVKQLPGDLDDLANPLVLANDSTIGTGTSVTVLSGSENTLWKGPYIDLAVPIDLADDRTVPTGFGARIVEGFVCYNASNNQHGVTDSTTSAAAAANDPACPVAVTSSQQAFIAVQILGIACNTGTGTTFMAVNKLFDGASETGAGAATGGRVRCETGAATGNKDTAVDVLWFLSIPIS